MSTTTARRRARPRGRRAAGARTPGWPMFLQAWIGSRGLILVVALFICVYYNAQLEKIVSNWDAQHFYSIARLGYARPTDAAFFPGFPLVLHGLTLLGLPMWIGGCLTSLACSFLAALALWHLGGKRTGVWAAAAWLIAPTAVFTVVPYTESLFCACAFWAWYFARRQSWFLMGLLAGAACAVRVSGLFLVGALVVLLVSEAIRHGRAWLDGLIGLVIPVAVLFAYALYQWNRTGDWMAWYHAQAAGWARGWATPWQSFLNTLPPALGAYADHPGWDWIFRGEIVSMVVGVIVTVVCLVRRQWGEASWVGVQVLAFSLSYWWMSVNRAVLLWFPLWLLIGELGCWKPRQRGLAIAWQAFVVVCVLASCVVAAFWASFFFLGMWAS